MAISLIVITININNEKEYTLTVGTSVGGKVQLLVDDTVYDISANRSKSFEIKKKSDVTVKAFPELGYEFTNWEIDGADKGANVEVEIDVSKQSDIYAAFSVSKLDLTIIEANQNTTTLSYSPASTLLSCLESNFKAETGYKYIFKINGVEVTATTQITESAIITVEKVPVVYTITYKNNDGSNYEVVEFTIETDVTTLTTPEVPSVEHYTTSWEKEANYKLYEDQVINLSKTPIEYELKFVHSGVQVGETVKYTCETNFADIAKPEINEVTEDYYTISWPETIEYTYSLEGQVVESVKTPIVNTIVYKDEDGNVVKTISFTKDDFVNKTAEIFVAPDAPTKEYYTVSWAKDIATILAEDLNSYCGKAKSISSEIKTNAVAIPYTVTFKGTDGTEFTSTDNQFSADDMNISLPTSPSKNGVYYLFKKPTLTLGENITVYADTYIKISFQKTIGGEVEQDVNETGSTFVKLLKDGSIETKDGTVVIYDIPSTTKTAKVADFTALVEKLKKSPLSGFSVKSIKCNSSSPISVSSTLFASKLSALLAKQTQQAIISIDFE